jgi:hypothetical protein
MSWKWKLGYAPLQLFIGIWVYNSAIAGEVGFAALMGFALLYNIFTIWKPAA